MSLRLVSAKLLAEDLAGGRVSDRDQAMYLAASFVIWAVVGYLYVVPPQLTNDRFFSIGMWAYDFAGTLLIYLVGVPYCLRRCRVDPQRNFLIDFSCLYVPVSVTSLLFIWTIFHLYTQGLLRFLSTFPYETSPPAVVTFLYNTRFLDVLRSLAVVGVSALVFWRVGYWLSYISERREA